MQDHPTVEQLLVAIRRFLDEEIVPHTDGRRQFIARVASNTLGIVERELRLEEEHLRADWAGLQALLGAQPDPASLADLRAAVRRRTDDLCARIRAGDADDDPWSTAVFEHVHARTRDKLSVSNPGYL